MAGKTSSNDDLVAEINVTPLVDIMLVLLIIFMLTSSTLQASTPQIIDVDLPVAASGQKKASQPISLTLDKAGKLYLDGKPATEAEIATVVQARVKSEPGVTALVSADRSASHGTVVGLLDLLRVQGVKDVALNTKAQDIEGGR
jgi:biopolymer transport protein ExbD